MKKNLIRLFGVAMAAVCVMSLSACGGNNSSKAESGAGSVAGGNTSSSVSTAAPESSQPAEVSSQAAAGGLGTVEDFVNSDLVQSQLKAMKDSMGEQGQDIDVTAEGNKLVYVFTYGDLGDTDRDTLAAALEGAMESMDDTFVAVADQLKTAVGQDDVSVEVRYVDGDGAEIYSKEYFPAE